MAATLTRTKKVKNLTPDEFQACYSLNLRYNGLMRSQLLAAYRGKHRWEHSDTGQWGYQDPNQVYATLRFNKEGNLAGWALIFTDEYDILSAYFYVRKIQRRTGIASHLVKHVNKKFGQVRVYPHDDTSSGFFNHVHDSNLNVDIDRRWYW